MKQNFWTPSLQDFGGKLELLCTQIILGAWSERRLQSMCVCVCLSAWYDCVFEMQTSTDFVRLGAHLWAADEWILVTLQSSQSLLCAPVKRFHFLHFLFSKLLLLAHTLFGLFRKAKCVYPADFEVPLLNSDSPKGAFERWFSLQVFQIIMRICL